MSKRAERRLLALFAVADRPLTGLEITKVTGLGPARLYPALQRLEDDGAITRRRDDEPMDGTELHRYRYAAAT